MVFLKSAMSCQVFRCPEFIMCNKLAPWIHFVVV